MPVTVPVTTPAVVGMSQLKTVSEYISDVRTVLQDTISPYRYDDPSLLVAFNLALLEGRRLRPDLFIYNEFEENEDEKVPSYSVIDNSPVPMEQPFRMAFVYATAAHALSRDQDDVQDARSTSFFNVFNSILLGLKMAPIQGASPAGPQPKG